MLSLQSQMVVHGLSFDVVVYTTLMDGLFKSGKLNEVEMMFNRLLAIV